MGLRRNIFYLLTCVLDSDHIVKHCNWTAAGALGFVWGEYIRYTRYSKEMQYVDSRRYVSAY